MEIQEKRKLLEEVLGDALKGFKKLIESSTGGMVEVHYSVEGV